MRGINKDIPIVIIVKTAWGHLQYIYKYNASLTCAYLEWNSLHYDVAGTVCFSETLIKPCLVIFNQCGRDCILF